jgi:hypothetical protein
MCDTYLQMGIAATPLNLPRHSKSLHNRCINNTALQGDSRIRHEPAGF